MSEHKENWTVYKNSCYFEILDADGIEIGNTCPASCHGDLDLGEKYARRIVAAVNACAGIENDELESVSYVELLDSHQLHKQQRDALLEALKDAEWRVTDIREMLIGSSSIGGGSLYGIDEWSTPAKNLERAAEVMRQAIAKVEAQS